MAKGSKKSDERPRDRGMAAEEFEEERPTERQPSDVRLVQTESDDERS